METSFRDNKHRPRRNMNLRIVDHSLSLLLKIIGWNIAKRPIYFIIFPCILTIILGTGIARMNYNRDMSYLGVSQTGRAANSMRTVETLYPENSSYSLDVAKTTRQISGPVIQIFNKHGPSVLHEDVFKELNQLDEFVRGITISKEGIEVGYNEICARKNGKCLENPVMKLIPKTQEIVSRKYRINFPIKVDVARLSYEPYALNFGGVTVDENSKVEDVEAFRLMYVTDPNKEPLITEWENAVVSELLQRKFDNITIIPFVFSNFMKNVKEFTETSPPVAGIVAAIVALFSVISCMTDNMVRSKPWLGLSACISAGMSLITAFGAMSYVGVENNDASICLCFLVLGTEIDDAYILIAAWRATNSTDSVEKRLGDTYKEAAVSITITSVTNILSLCVGLTAPFPVVRLFCGYAAAAMFVTYLYQISFFGACMALDGYREKRNLNPFTFRKMSGKMGSLQEEKAMTIVKNIIGGFLSHSLVKVTIVITFVANLCLGVWGLFHLHDGVDPRVLISKDSLAYKFYTNHYRYFGQYPGSVQIILNKTLSYENPAVQISIEEMIQNLTSHPNFAGSEYSLNWLKFYKMFISHPLGGFLMRGYNLSDKADFIHGLRYVFLRLAKEFEDDVIFNENETEIVCSRFILLQKDIYDEQTNMAFLKDVWKIADQSEFPITLYSNRFPLLEQAIIIRGITVQITWLTTLLLMIVFFLFIPRPLTTLVISFVIVSTIIETAGYMAFWGVTLDMGTVTVIILCVGFSVNYPCHAAYAFVTSQEKTPNGKMRDCLYHVGLPIIQGSLSTILAISVLAFNQVRAYVIFFIIVFLIALFTSFHALFVVPILLNIVEHITNKCKKIYNGLG